MAIIEKRYSLVESTAETIKVQSITLPKETGPWILVEVEMDVSLPGRPTAPAIADVTAAFGNIKESPTSVGLDQAGAISTHCARRSATDTMMTTGPVRWDGAEMCQLQGDYYYAWLAVKSANQATPAVQGVSARMKFVTPDELK